MSVEAMSWVLNHSTTTGTDKIVLLGIANHADENGENAWPSVATLARYAGVSERAVQYALRKLEAAGAITVAKQAGGTHHTAPDRRPNLYTLRMDGVKHVAPRGVKPASQRGEERRPNGVKPIAPESSLNHPEPSAADAQKIERAISTAARVMRVKRQTLRSYEDDLARFCLRWPDISSDQLAAYITDGSLPRSVHCLKEAS